MLQNVTILFHRCFYVIVIMSHIFTSYIIFLPQLSNEYVPCYVSGTLTSSFGDDMVAMCCYGSSRTFDQVTISFVI